MIQSETIYEVYWEGPFTIDELKKYAQEEVELSKHWSLYAKYEDHPIYGREVLTYIGKAVKQDVLKRLTQHELGYEKVYVGIIYKFENWEKTNIFFEKNWVDHKENIIKCDSKVSAIEELFIHALWPAYNIRNKQSAKNSWPYRIFNTGYLGSIPGEISGQYVMEKIPKTIQQDE